MALRFGLGVAMIPNMIVPTLTRHDLLTQMLKSIDYPVGLLIIINNHPNANFEGTDSIPDCVADYRVLNMPSNLGCAGSWNLGIKLQPFAPWWLVASDDVVFEPGALEKFAGECSPDRLTVLDEWPHWQFFGVGCAVVDRVGLFDENFYPANFEDDDYQRRCEVAGVEVYHANVAHFHVKQATVHAREWAASNARTYNANETYFVRKIERRDVSAGDWSLKIRRANDWAREL
jgi:GT2 family glycosyltransferase